MTPKQKYRSTTKGKETERSYNISTNYASQKKWAKSAAGKLWSKNRSASESMKAYQRKYMRDRYKNDSEYRSKVLLRQKKFRLTQKGIDYFRNVSLKKTFGISLIEYNLLLKKQNNRCGCCNKSQSKLMKRLAVDHCHKTNRIRGLLCYNCNVGIGLLGDSKESIASAMTYLNNGLSIKGRI